jgi:hypothetical protein
MLSSCLTQWRTFLKESFSDSMRFPFPGQRVRQSPMVQVKCQKPRRFHNHYYSYRDCSIFIRPVKSLRTRFNLLERSSWNHQAGRVLLPTDCLALP